MRKYLLSIALFVSMLVLAQSKDDQCASIQGMYDKKVEENFVLRGEITRLQTDSLQYKNVITSLMQDTAQLSKKLRDTKMHLNSVEQSLQQNNNLLTQCRKDSAQMQKTLKKCNPESIQHYEDSITHLNRNISLLNDSIASLNKSLKDKNQLQQRQQFDIIKLNALAYYLDSRFVGKSVDDIYETMCKGELIMCADIYSKLSKNLPKNIQLTISCFTAEELTTRKYNKIDIDNTIVKLPSNSKIGRSLVIRLQNYVVINSAANQLWDNIKTEVCSDVIPNDDFSQIQKKRQIWQRTQKFFNQYPTLATDYPYIFDQLQYMLREIWVNANNFNKIQNPFE